MDTVTRLNAAVTMLTRPHPERITDPDGRTVFITVEPLLLQLSLAIRNTTAGAAFKSGNVNPPLPLSAEAVALMDDIYNTATEQWWVHYRHHFGEGRGTIGGRIRAWAMAAQHEPHALADAERIMSAWVRDIRGLLEPVRRVTITGACPDCGESRIRRQDQDGGTVSDHTLSIAFDGDGNPSLGTCAACKHTWPWAALAEEMGVNNGRNRGDVSAV